ncbi:hypothetical protein WKI71_33760 [Streptomyces sp. MS1.AVA.1]|uniref:Transposase n=1 Tax=Streptomyces machairae TaxID=3134109 RepID=A0ABU8URJ8_9ACTN
MEWTRFLEPRVRAAYRRWQTTPFAGFAGAFTPGADMGRDGCSLNRRSRVAGHGGRQAVVVHVVVRPRGNRLVAETVRNPGT